MNINVDYESTAKRRLIIASAIIPFTVYVFFNSARLGVAQMWRDAAFHWKPRPSLASPDLSSMGGKGGT